MNWIKPDWPAPANISAATTLRVGGVSQPPYASLNPALHVGDQERAVMQNRGLIKKMLQLPSTPAWLNQVHGCHVVQADRVKGLPEADASFTRQPDTVCAVLTADCLPVLFATADGRQVAAAHAGWRGLLAGVIEQTLCKLNNKDVLIWLGPAIGSQCFEVGNEVRQAFLTQSAEFSGAFVQHTANKWLADIYQLARCILQREGFNTIYGGDFCTVTAATDFFSYRRDGETGRMATLIWRS
jgi:purine-nucleoside/S-methyl-5'-thioadenosine phosphorylase / adenosine deaminase